MKSSIKKIICFMLALAVFMGALPALADKGTENKNFETEFVLSVGKEYTEYIAEHSSKKINMQGEDIVLSGISPAKKSDNAQISSNINNSSKGGVMIPDDGFASWNLTVKQDSLYIIKVSYTTSKNGSGNLESALKIDGKTPFRQASIFSFSRSYEQDLKSKQKTINGNDRKPDVNEIFVWRESELSDSSGYTLTPFMFFFSKGKHTLTFEGCRGEIVIGNITLTNYKKPISYKEYCNCFGNDEAKNAKQVVIEAERFTSKSSVTVLPKADRSSPATTPQSPYSLKLNTVGGDSWKNVGEAVTWNFEVEKSGIYEIALRFRQSLKDGIFTTRKLYIDGKVPFDEAQFLRFRYSSKWQSEKLGNDSGAFSFYLEKGKHTLTMEVTSGEISEIVGTIQKSINDLNKIYRRIMMITGTTPDANRDYNFEALIPDEIKQMKDIKTALQSSVDYINEQAGTNGSYVSIIQKIIFELSQMTDKPRNIAKYLLRFKSDLGAMSEWIMTASEQPLEIDKLTVMPKGNEVSSVESSFFKRFLFSVECFISSYMTDYSSLGTAGESSGKENIKVWIQTGRDQAEIVRDLITDSFVKQCDATVTLEIVQGALLTSVLAGISPDVVLDNAESIPMEFALRNAVADLKEFKDYDEVKKIFPEAALKPAEFNGKVYGLPQSFSFPMFFYRTDIFEEYGYTVPKTWKEICAMIPSLQRKGLEIGIPQGMYSTFLYQNGGEFYKDNGKECKLSDSVSIESFADYMELYTLYDCPVTFSFANRFRNGEMPCAVADYTTCNTLTAFAPEIKGLWEMVPIPGVIGKDGKINNVAVGASTYMMMMRNTKHRELAWKFMKWFMSTDVQVNYAYRMESILGTCAKVPTANIQALSKMSWTGKEYKNLLAQLSNVDAVPQVPGGYYLNRVLGFAFSRVYNESEDPSEALPDYKKELNDELTRKRAEFGLE